VLKAKIKIFTELFRKTRQLEALNRDLEDRVRERTLEVEQSAEDLRNSERRRGEKEGERTHGVSSRCRG